jgi:hypothetical protein
MALKRKKAFHKHVFKIKFGNHQREGTLPAGCDAVGLILELVGPQLVEMLPVTK